MADQQQSHVGSQDSHRPLLQAERLTKVFTAGRGLLSKPQLVHAVESVTFHVKHAETLGLVGESGCGKSTLGKTLLRLIEPTYGRIVLDGTDLTPLSQSQLRPLRRRMQIIFQDPYASLNPRMTVGETVAEGMRIHKLAASRSELRERVEGLLQSVGLSARDMPLYPHQFSAGQRQRIGIARALAVEPSFVVCDEPISALDASIQAQIVNVLLEMQERTRASYLFISHDLPMVRHLAHRVAVMYLGHLVELGPAQEVLSHPQHPYTRALADAVPVAEPGHRRLRVVLEGEPADARRPPSGCVFHPRCPRADGRACVTQVPHLRELQVDSHHRVACWHPLQD